MALDNDLQVQNKRLVRVLSKERLQGYLTSLAQKHRCSPISLYHWNIVLSENLYSSLNVIEIILRNTLHVSIAEHFENFDWLLDPKILDYKERIEVKKQEIYLRQAGKPITTNNLIPELNFGFWTSLLDSRYEMKFWRSRIIKRAFPYMESKIRMRHNISRQFNKIRKLRNRIFHYEPIWFWKDLREQYEGILLAISWIEPLALELRSQEHFIKIYKRGPNRLKQKTKQTETDLV